MRKHFLLLLLLTLLPLAGWAQTANTGLKWNGSPQTLVTWTGGGYGVTHYYAFNTTGTKPGSASASTTVPQATNADTYHVWCASHSGGGSLSNSEWNSATHLTVTIAKAEPVITLLGFEVPYSDSWTEPSVATMPSTSYTFDADGTPLTFDDIKSKLTWHRYSTSHDAGTYPYTLDIDNSNTNYEIKVSPGNLVIAAVDGSWTTTPAGKATGATEKYDGTDKTLADLIATEAVYSGGTVEYSADGLAWSEDLSTIVVGKDAGTYPIQYRGNGDKNHNDFAGGTFNVLIDKYQVTEGTDFNALTAVTPNVYTGSDLPLVNEVNWTGPFATELAGADILYNSAVSIPTAFAVGIYPVALTFDFTGAPNFEYVGTAISVNGEITKAEAGALTVTPAADLKFKYADPNIAVKQDLIASASCEGATVMYSLTGAAGSYTATIPQGDHVGTYTVYYYAKGDANHNDNGAEGDDTSVDVTIEAVPFVLASTPTAKTGLIYTGADQSLLASGISRDKSKCPQGAITYTVTDPQNNTATVDGSALANVVGKNAGDYTITWSVVPADPAFVNDYTAVETAAGDEVIATIGKKGLTLTGASLGADYDPALKYDKTQLFIYSEGDFVAADKTNAQTIASSLITVTLDNSDDYNKLVETETEAGLNAGTYAIKLAVDATADVQNYEIEKLTDGQLTIATIDPTAATVAPTFADLTYNGEDQALATAGTSDPSEGKWMYRLEGAAAEAVPTGKDAGTYTVYYKFVGDRNHNNIDEASATVKIIPVDPTVTVAITGWTYGDYDAVANAPVVSADFKAEGEPTIEYSVKGADSWSTEVPTDFGEYTVRASVAKADNWNAAEATADFAIGKATLEIELDDLSKVYGAADPELTYSAVAFKYDDDATTIELEGIREEGETVGTYEIDAKWNAEKAKNYNITVTKGTFTITAAELEIEVADNTKVYGDEDPELVLANEPAYQNGDDAEKIGLKIEREAGEDVGKYAITATATSTNYTYKFTAGEFEITKAPLTLTAKALTKVYGEADPELKLAEDPAYKNGDDATAIGLTITREEGENVGTYVITPAATSENYEYEIVEADFEITPATLVYTLTNAEYTYTGEAINPVEGETFVKTDGKFFFEDAYGKTFTFAWPDEAEVKDAGTYNFIKLETVWAEGQAENYYVVFSKDAVITVAPAEIAVTAPVAAEGLIFSGEDQELIAAAGEAKFGEDAFDFEYTLDELKSDKAEEIVATDAAEYEIAWKVVDETGNFTFVPAEGTIKATIAPAKWDLTVAELEAAIAGDALVYDGTAKFDEDLTKLTVKSGETVLTDKDYKVEVKKGEEAATKFINAGTYTFTFTGIGNYADEANVETYDLTIEKADITVKAPVANLGDKGTGLEYEKTEFTLIATPAVATVAATDAFEPVVLYSLTDEEEYYDAALPKAMNAGDYDVYYMVKGDANHNDFVAEAPVTVNIAKAELIATAPNAKKTYDGTTDVENEEFGEFAYSGLLGGDHVDLGEATISDFVIVPEDAINVGEYTLTIKDVTAFPEQLNYYVGSALPGTLTIDPAKEVTIAFTAAAKYGKEYAAKDDLKVVATDLMASPAAGWFDDFADIADQLTISREEGEDVGTYDVMLALGEKAEFQKNYEKVNFAVGVDKFEITPFATELKISIASASRNFNGEVASYDWAEDLSNMVVTNLPEGKEKSGIFTTKPEVKVVAAGKNVGEYNVELSGGESKNYTFKLLPGSYYTIEPVVVKAVFNSIPVAAVGLLGEDVLAQVDWAVEAVDEEDAATVTANKDLFELIFADGVLDANKKIAEGETGEDALIINYKGTEDPANFAWDEDGNTADLNIGGAGAEVALDDAGEIVTYASENSTVTFTQSRKVKTNVWQAAVLPFDATPAQISDAFGYAAVDLFDASRTNADEVHFSLNVSETVKAGTPFLFKTDNEVDFNTVKFENVNLVNTEGLNTTVKDDDTDIEFIGTFEKIGVWGKEFRYLSSGTWYNAGKYTEAKPAYIKPLRAYLNMGSYASARIVIEENDGTTSIMDVRSFNEDMTAEGWYTIDGKKLEAVPTQKGVYINNGKKVVVK